MKHKLIAALVAAMSLLMMVSPVTAEEEPYSLYAFINERVETLGDFDDWPFEEKAAFSAWCTQEDIAYRVVFGIPGEGNMTPEEVAEMLKAAIIDKYGIAPELFEQYNVQIDFIVGFGDEAAWAVFDYVPPDAANPLWEVVFRLKEMEDQSAYDAYYFAYVYDQAREVYHLVNQDELPG